MNPNNLDLKKDSQSSIPKSEIIIDKEHNIRYRKGKKLGMGGFGEVYEFIIIETNEKRAAKIISNSKIDDPQSQSAYFYEKKFNELLGFKYLCKCYNIFNDEQNTYFILDYMKNKTLNELNEKRRLTELEIKHYCFELLLAIEYLHKMNIIHRDIKLSNVLLNENMEVRLCDFGLAIDNGVKEQKNICGTLNYIAPELYNKKGGLKYSFKTDIWAFGVLMYSLFFKKTPFKKEPKKKIDYNTQNIDVSFPKDVYISKEAKDLLKKILVKDPDNRPKIETIKASSFFRNGKGIPKFLPESTMEKPMNRDEEEKFVNNAIFKGECLDKDCDLPDKVANKRSYTERNEMESNFDQDDSSSKEDEEEDENKSEESSNKNQNNNYLGNTNNHNNNERKEHEHNLLVKIDKNKPRNSLSFSNIIVEKNGSREETNKNIKVLNGTNEKINEHQDSNKISEKNSGQFTPNFKLKGEEDSDNHDKNILSPDFEKKINKKFLEKLDLNNKVNNNIDGKKEIEIEEFKIKTINNNNKKFENDKNDYNEEHNKKKTLKEKIMNSNNNITIKKFIDLSDKCGMGYLLTNDDIGIYFNDNTKMIKIKNSNNLIYINEQGKQTTFNIKKSKLNYDIKTKVNALFLFNREFNKNSLNKKGFDNNQKIPKEKPDLFVKKWIKSQYAYFFLLSNDKVQIIFEDKSQLIFDFYQKKICFINKMKENSIYNIDNTRFENDSIEQKVRYVKRILKKIS